MASSSAQAHDESRSAADVESAHSSRMDEDSDLDSRLGAPAPGSSESAPMDEEGFAAESSSSAADSEDVRWRRTREADATPEAHSGSATPGMSNSLTLLKPAEAADGAAATAAGSAAASRPPRPAGWASFDEEAAATPHSSGYASGPATPASRTLSVDAEDEDVKIAIMALGAMKQLDGTTSSSSSSGASRERTDSDAGLHQHPLDPAGRLRRGHSPSRGPSSYQSNSSAPSTALSSPMSTPSELTASVTSASSSSRRATTLGDLPPDFPFPAVIHDEDGNEIAVNPEMMQDADFLRRVSHLPIVRGTLRAYELGKQKSRVVKYGGDLVESSVKAIGRPVVHHLSAHLGEKGVEQLDAFATRQLERASSQLYPSADGAPSREEKQQLIDELNERERTEWKDFSVEEKAKRRQAYWALRMEDRDREMVTHELRQRKGKGKATAQQQQEQQHGQTFADGPQSTALVQSNSSEGYSAANRARSYPAGAMAEVAQQAKPLGGGGWGSMLVEAGVTAGGLSAAVSEESMKSLKYCLQWLQYATAHIEHQITILRDLIVKLNHGELEISSAALQNLGSIRSDVVSTIRGVVDVVGKYAGGALPEPARGSVRAFILGLPARWASVNRPTGVAAPGSPAGSFGGSPASPSFSAAHISGGGSAQQLNQGPQRATAAAAARQQQQMQLQATAQAANRVLTFAVESLDVLRSVTIVFGESLDRADLWVERLRVLGLQRKRAHEQAAAEEAAARIDQGMGGYLAGGASGMQAWENARGLAGRHASPGTESNVSMGTTTSGSKRRRVRGGDVSSRSPSASAGPGPARHRSVGMSDESDGAHTETEHRSTRMPPFTPGSSGAASSAIAAHASHAGSSQRRKQRGSKSHHAARTPSANNTPAFKELSLYGSETHERKHAS